MRTYKTIILLLLISTNYCLSQKKIDDKRRFKSIIEISIDSTSRKINPLIGKINILIKEGKPSEELVEMYNESKKSFNIYKELVEKQTEVDSKINLKSQTLIYLDNCEKLLDNLILPTIRYLNNSEHFDKDKIIQAFHLAEDAMNETAILSEKMDEFCNKYKLSRRLNDFDKEDYRDLIDEFNSKVKN